LQKSTEKYSKKQNKGMIVKPKLTIPSMPVREIPKFAYSGYGSDTVGPARYTP